MSKRRKILFASILGGATFVSFSLCFSNKGPFGAKLFANGTEIWSHYQELAPTFDKVGVREYWISCDSHEIVFIKPDVASNNIVEKGVPSQEFLNGLQPGDSRIADKFETIYTFEDNKVPSCLTAVANIKSFEIDATNGTRGSKCLKVNIGGSDYSFGLTKSYFDAAFADESVNAVKFDAKGTINSNNFRYRTKYNCSGDSNTFEEYNSGSGITTNWKTFYFTRNMYNSWTTGSAMLKGGDYPNGSTLWIDNIELSKISYDATSKSNEYVGFEFGTVVNKSTDSSGSFSIRSTSGELGLVSGAGVDAVDFDYTKHTEGNRSLHIHKVSGKYVAFYLSKAFYNSLSDEGVYFDMFTDDGINSSPTVKNLQTGVNTVFNKAQTAGRWQQYHMTKSQISTDGRLLQFNGTTTNGNIWIDNIRPANGAYENSESAYALKAGDYVTFADFEVTESNYNTIRDSYKNYTLIVNGGNQSGAEISLDHPEDWHYRSMKTTYSAKGSCAIFFNPTFLEDNFYNGVSFDIYTEQTFTGGTSFGGKVNAIGTNKWGTVTLAEDELYDPAKPGQNVINGRVFNGNFNASGSFYIDNIRPASLADIRSGLDFESGYVESVTSGTTRKFNYIGQTATVDIYAQGATTNLTGGTIATSPLRGDHSFKITKANNYIAIYLNLDIVNKMNDNDLLTFDLYSTVAANTKDAVNNLQTGMSRKLGLYDYQHPANEWKTYSLKKVDFSIDSTSARFLQIQGSTAGDWYIDNIHIEGNNEYTDSYAKYITQGGSVTVNLNQPVGNRKVYVDGKYVSNFDYITNENSITFKPGKIANGEHKLSFGDRTNRYTTNTDSYYFACYVASETINHSATLSYGSDAYQTINGITNPNRVVFNGKSVGYERSGNDILIADATLVECLPTVNGAKTSGTVDLIVLCDDYNVTVKQISVAVTLSGDATIKTGYTKQAEGSFEFFGYSSTGGGKSKELNSIDDIMGLKRSGLDNLYEQLSGLPITIPDNYFTDYALYGRHLTDLDRCMEAGIGGILTDNFTNKLCQEKSSILGRDIVLDSSTTVHFNNEADIYNALYARISKIASHPALKKYVICDEPHVTSLLPTSQIYNQAVKVFKDLGRSDVEVNVNLLPISAGYTGDDARWDGIGNPITGSEGWFKSAGEKKAIVYKSYLQTWIDLTGADYITFDIYPLNTYVAEADGDNKDNRSGIDKWWYENMFVASDFCKSHGLELHVVTQTCTLVDRSEGQNRRVMSADDMRYLHNILMGFGVNEISYFTYYNRNVSGSSEFGDIGSMMIENWDGDTFLGATRTPVWYTAQIAMEEAKEFAPTLFNFDYVSGRILRGSKYTNQGEAYEWGEEQAASNFNSFGTCTNVSIDNGYCVTTALKDSDDKYMTMVANVSDPLTDMRVQTVTMTFSSGTYAVVYENGASRIVNLKTVSKKQTLTLKLSSGNAAYVIVY